MSAAPRILVVDDTPQNVKLLGDVLGIKGYEVTAAASGTQALEQIAERRPDLVLLDVVMPGMSGYEVCKRIRETPATATLPVVMVTALDPATERIKGIEAGADDFVTKPFSTPELLARIRAALRRVPAAQSSSGKFRAGELTIDFGARTVSRGGVTNHLTPKELDLLRYLTQHANEAVPHRELLQAVWGPDYGDQVDYLRVFIKTLRKKIEPNPESPRYVLTEPWIGYRFSGTVEACA